MYVAVSLTVVAVLAGLALWDNAHYCPTCHRRWSTIAARGRHEKVRHQG